MVVVEHGATDQSSTAGKSDVGLEAPISFILGSRRAEMLLCRLLAIRIL